MSICRKLSTMPYAQAHVVVDDDNNTYLISYCTHVMTIDKDGWATVYGLYSATTRRHIGAFVKEYVTYPNGERGYYGTFRDLYKDGLSLNINTGEVREA